MADTTTLARPYAKALFEHALAENRLKEWSSLLQRLAFITVHAEAFEFLSNPSVSNQQQYDFLLSLTGAGTDKKDTTALENFIGLLIENKRINLLADISIQYDTLRAEQEKTLVARVLTYSELTETQKSELIKALSLRLKRQVTLDIHLQPSLLGGALIQAGDLVIDGTLRGQLNKLQTSLVA